MNKQPGGSNPGQVRNARLVVAGGKRTSQKEVPLKLPAVIGRGEEATVLVVDPERTISRTHCRIFEYEGGLVVRDLNSRNGTYVGNERIKEARLQPGDLLSIGPVVFRVEFEGAKLAVAPAPSTSSAAPVAPALATPTPKSSPLVSAVESNPEPTIAFAPAAGAAVLGAVIAGGTAAAASQVTEITAESPVEVEDISLDALDLDPTDAGGIEISEIEMDAPPVESPEAERVMAEPPQSMQPVADLSTLTSAEPPQSGPPQSGSSQPEPLQPEVETPGELFSQSPGFALDDDDLELSLDFEDEPANGASPSMETEARADRSVTPVAEVELSAAASGEAEGGLEFLSDLGEPEESHAAPAATSAHPPAAKEDELDFLELDLDES